MSKIPQTREMLDPDAQAQPTHIQGYGLGLAVLGGFNEIVGAKGSVLFGGALRDAAFGIQPADFDIRLDIKQTDLWLEHRENPYQVIQGIKQKLEERGFTMQPLTQSSSVGEGARGKIRAKKDGMTLDIILTDQDIDLSQEAMRGDSTINAVAMDSLGNIMAHPKFSKDIEDKVFRIRVADKSEQEKSIERYKKLANRVRGLKLYIGDALYAQEVHGEVRPAGEALKSEYRQRRDPRQPRIT